MKMPPTEKINLDSTLIRAANTHLRKLFRERCYVGYNYDQTASAGEFTRSLRPNSLRYPNGRLVHYAYGNTGSDDDHLSRIAAIMDDDNGLPGATLASYSYLGLNQMVIQDLEEPQVRLDYFGGVPGSYVGMDRFDRVIDQRWRAYGPGEDRDRFKYGYDRTSNRVWKENVVSKNLATPVYLDEFSTYDGMNRLRSFDQGQLTATMTGITGTPSSEEDWALDPLGNWSNYVKKTSGTADIDQDRTVSRANEIVGLSESVGTPWATPLYDRNGNITSMPQPSDLTKSYECIWDAWNRLVKVEDVAMIAEYAYDGLMRRVCKAINSAMRHFYFSVQWQVVEERLDVSAEPAAQFVWGPRYIDHLILLDRDMSEPADGTLDQRIWALQDATWNIDAVIDDAGSVKERYLHSAHGSRVVLSVNWLPKGAADFEASYSYSGRRLDSETGVQWFRRREYNPSIGSFLSRNPNEYVDGLNLYRPYFVPNSLDPFGTDVFEDYPRGELDRFNERLASFTTFIDVFIGHVAQFPKGESRRTIYRNAVKNILTLQNDKDCFSFKTKWITERSPDTLGIVSTIGQFAEDAKKEAARHDCTVFFYFGHAINRQAAPQWGELLAGIPDRTKIGLYTCFSDFFLSEIPEKHRLKGGFSTKGFDTPDVWLNDFNTQFDKIKAGLDDLCVQCECKHNADKTVKAFLYFAQYNAIGQRAQDMRAENDRLEGLIEIYNYLNWARIKE